MLRAHDTVLDFQTKLKKVFNSRSLARLRIFMTFQILIGSRVKKRKMYMNEKFIMPGLMNSFLPVIQVRFQCHI